MDKAIPISQSTDVVKVFSVLIDGRTIRSRVNWTHLERVRHARARRDAVAGDARRLGLLEVALAPAFA